MSIILLRKENLTKRVLQERLDHNDVVAQLRTSIGDSIRSKYLFENILKKYADPDPAKAEERKRSALAKFLRQGRINAATEKRLSKLSNQEILPGKTREAMLFMASRHIARILGSFSFVRCVVKHASFSGGASTAFKRTPGVLQQKFGKPSHITPTLNSYLSTFVKTDSLLIINEETDEARVLKLRKGNEMFTVPKDNDIDRAACKEPDFNMFFQKGLGTFIRRRLKKNGIDLNDQTINQKLAKEGSLTGDLCTIDLSAASDSITPKLVSQLFPVEWDYALNALRSEYTLINKKWRRLPIFSTMGNGFTFEMQSLIFYSLMLSIRDAYGNADDTISVYGDDLIVPSHYYPLAKILFEELGFKFNDDKSFYEGTFRESCGKWYDAGVDVTPFFIRKPIDSLQRIIWLFNSVKRWDMIDDLLCHECAPFMEWLWKRVPVLKKLMYPGDFSSDSSLVSPYVVGRLHANTREVKVSAIGAYTAALWKGGEYSRVMVPTGTYSLRFYSTGTWTIQGSPDRKWVIPAYEVETSAFHEMETHR